jgi:hypothetical protein
MDKEKKRLIIVLLATLLIAVVVGLVVDWVYNLGKSELVELGEKGILLEGKIIGEPTPVPDKGKLLWKIMILYDKEKCFMDEVVISHKELMAQGKGAFRINKPIKFVKMPICDGKDELLLFHSFGKI